MTTDKLTITILGAGNIGGTLGQKWHDAGHKVIFGVSNPEGKHGTELRAELGESVIVATASEALAHEADVVVMALPGTAMESSIITHAAQLDGKIIIDTANRLGGGPLNSLETFQQHTPHAQIYRAFNTLGWENFADPLFDGVQADLFYCGPEGEPQKIVKQLISDVGLRPIYLGGVEQTSLVDSIGSLWFALVFGQHKSRHLAFKLLTR
jgi:8-hydroxy-5-deazaflavin:NADPH oxidoreductase